MTTTLYRGEIHWLFTSKGSEMAILGVEDDRRGRVLVPCSKTATARALNHALGGTLIVDEVFDAEAIQGVRFYYTLDSTGFLESFTIETDAGSDMTEAYEAQSPPPKRGSPAERGLLPHQFN